jgi:hypothetical protein
LLGREDTSHWKILFPISNLFDKVRYKIAERTVIFGVLVFFLMFSELG